jgi:hypothetical protein
MKAPMLSPSKGTGANKPQREDWDFSSCGDEELHVCHLYEIARESKTHRDLVLKWRNGHKAVTFDDWIPVIARVSRADRAPVFGWDLFPYCPEWPQRPYLSILPEERLRRLKLAVKILQPTDPVNALRLGHLPGLLKGFSDGTPTGKKWIVPPQDKATILSEDGAAEKVMFDIDWRHTNGVLVNRFRKFLETRRPREVRQWIIKGMGRPSAQLRKDLKALGAWRLLRTMKWDEAEAQTTAHLSSSAKPLFEGQPTWIKARHHAEKVLAGFFGLNSF